MIFSIRPEALITAVALLVGILFPRFGLKWFSRASVALSAIARKRRTSVLLCGTLALALRAAVLPILPIPIPYIHDEFSFLLAADTFTHWRLTNPTPPMWIHFETLHVIFTPTYASMYPPLQGAFLAGGKIVAGHPFWGVWFSVGLMCASICWMLQAWFPPVWALIGGLLPVMRFGVFGWGVSYWGGAVAAMGGALVLGALPRIMRRQRIRDSLILAFGVGMLANSRPYEGVLLCVPAITILLVWILRERGSRTGKNMVLSRTILPFSCLLLVFLVITGYYFWRVTGSPFRMPYQVNRNTYSMARYFYFQGPHQVPTYHHEDIRRFYTNELLRYQQHRSLWGICWETGFKLMLGWLFYIGPALTIPLFTLPWVLRDRRLRPLLIVASVGVFGMELVIYFAPHYAAPFAGVIIALIIQGLRHLRAWKWDGRPVGAFLAHATVLICTLMLPIQIFALWAQVRSPGGRPRGIERQELLDHLRTLPGDQLIIVRYSPNHDVLSEEWVYNDADIDGSKIIWARDMGAEKNQELLDYYHDRKAWLVEPDKTPIVLQEYASGSAQYPENPSR